MHSLESWLELLEQRHAGVIELGLDRCTAVWERLGKPAPAPQVITVAGTNGKGSTVATLCAVLQSLGYRQGAYSSPHIVRFNERIQIQGRDVSDEELVAAFDEVEAARGDTRLTYFEFTTLAAFCCLARAELDYAVLEIGLGGRLDAVNIIDADCAVITPIGLDHQAYLGDDRESIGAEKAGIMRAGRPVVVSDRNPPRSVIDRAESLNCPLLQIGQGFEVQASAEQVELRIADEHWLLDSPRLEGPHQVDNLAGALAAVRSLLDLSPDPETTQALNRGIRAVNLPGRMQKVSDTPPTWLDVGHNPLAAKAIAAQLRRSLEAAEFKSVHAVFAMLRDKDATEFIRILRPYVAGWYCASLPGERGQGGQELAGLVESMTEHATVEGFDDVAEALKAAERETGASGAILVTGSFLTVARAMLHLEDTARIAGGQGKEENN